MKSDTENLENFNNIYNKDCQFHYPHPRPMVTADIIIYAKDEKQVLLIERKNDPFKGFLAFPGGYMEMDEPIKRTAIRELTEETGSDISGLSFLGYYDAVSRDPRGRTISFVFYAITEKSFKVKAGSDADRAEWFSVKSIPRLAFDHEKILKDFLKKNEE